MASKTTTINPAVNPYTGKALSAKQASVLQSQLAPAPKAAPVTTPKTTQTGAPLTSQQQQGRAELDASVGKTPAAPVTTAAQPTNTPAPTVTPAQTPPPSATPSSTTGTPMPYGFDESALLNAGISQDQINKMKAIITPQVDALETQKQRAGEVTNFIEEDLKAGQKEVEDLYTDVKARKETLTQEQLKINDETAKVQQDLATQEYQRNKFTQEQAAKQYELDAARAEMDLQTKNDEAAVAYRRALGAQLGASFGSEGLDRLVRAEQTGNQAVSDLRARTAIGKAEFSFKAMEIESKYTADLKSISTDRKASALSLYTTLNTELDSIDEKILLSKEEKRTAARTAVTDYYTKLDEIDGKAADLTSGAINTLYEEKKALEQEKLEKESFDQTMSQSLGFFANKYGQPIGVREGEPPKAYVGNFNEPLSKQLGYLVDERGQKILGDDGQKISYKDFSVDDNKAALSRYLKGSATGYDAAELNLSIGVNNYLKTAVEDGSYGGQCGTFIRTKFTNEPGWEACAPGDTACSVQSKKDLVDKRGFKTGEGVPKVGNVVIFTGPGYGSVGHYAMINEISEDQQWATLTESNMDLKGTVHTTRRVRLDDPAIYGFFPPDLKQEVVDSQPNFAPPEEAASEGGVDMGNLDFDAIGNSLEVFGPEETAKAIKAGKFNKKDGGLTKGDIDTNIKLSGLVKPIADGLRELDLQASAFKNVSPETRSAQTDQSLVYTFNKLLDPGSVVKESEYATVLKNSGWFNGVQGELSKAQGGALLTDSTRKKLLDEMNRLYDSKRDVYIDTLKEKREFIQNQEIDPNSVFPFDNYIENGDSTLNKEGSSSKSGYNFNDPEAAPLISATSITDNSKYGL